MPTPGDILLEFVLPSLLVAAGMAVGWWPLRGKARNGQWMGAIVVGAAFAWADCGISGYPGWPPGSGDAAYWVIWFAVPVAVFGVLDALFPIPVWPRATLVWILARIGGELLLGPLARNAIWPMQAAVDSMALVAAVWWVTWETLATRQTGMLGPVLITVVLAGAGGIYAMANDIKPSQAMVAMMGMGIAIIVAAWLWPTLSLARGAMLALVIPVLGLMALVHYYYYTEPPECAVSVLLGSPLLAFLGDLPGARKLGARGRFAVRVVPVVLGVCIAVGLSARQFLAPAAAGAGHPVVQPGEE